MKNLKILFTIFFIFLFVSGCQTVKQKTDAAIQKENKSFTPHLSLMRGKDLLGLDLLKVVTALNLAFSMWSELIEGEEEEVKKHRTQLFRQLFEGKFRDLS